jgi:hypothetical protein
MNLTVPCDGDRLITGVVTGLCPFWTSRAMGRERAGGLKCGRESPGRVGQEASRGSVDARSTEGLEPKAPPDMILSIRSLSRFPALRLSSLAGATVAATPVASATLKGSVTP